MKRRNLSGIFLFETFQGEERRKPTCFEDCYDDTQRTWLARLNREALENLALQLGQSLRSVGDELDLYKE